MTTKIFPARQENQQRRAENNDHPHHPPSNGASDAAIDGRFMPAVPERLLPKLPTFPLEDGWRLVYDEETKTTYHVPLTLRDILFSTEDDVGAVYMSQGQTHNWLISLLAELLRIHLGARGWSFLSDVLIRWEIPGVPDKSPDITAILNPTVAPTEEKKSFQVGSDGPMPAAVIEVTSESTRDQDFSAKRDIYAAVGIEEYLIIDIWNDRSAPWQLHGYRLGASPYYQPIAPAADGGITLQSLGLRFIPVGRERVDLFDSTTGERLRSGAEFRVMAEAEAARAQAAEATIAELTARLRALEAAANKDDPA
ncbi:MAG: Uma2 family endonuclease [Caldilineaceae bacterium]